MRARERSGEEERPSAPAILEVDAEYRAKSAANELRRITPRRFNPEGKAWLPVYHVEKKGWFFTALFSNSARAHKLGKTDDWVVIFFEADGHENQCTVVTEHQGAQADLRVVRGRETEGARAP